MLRTPLPLVDLFVALFVGLLVGLLIAVDAPAQELRTHPFDHDSAHRSNALPPLPASVPVTLNVTDFNGSRTYFHVTFIDNATGQPYPPMSPAQRDFPDFWLQEHIYRQTGDQVFVPPGTYTVKLGRGPEYMTDILSFMATPNEPTAIDHALRRWVHPATRGYYSGDHHLHAAGCPEISAQAGPNGGMLPEHMLAHVAGEGLNVGEVLIWGFGFAHAATQFSPVPHPVSTHQHLIKYDLEISKFGSESQGHNGLWRLSNMNYPGTGGSRFGWPTWSLPTLQWAKQQGAVTGTVHSGFGLATGNNRLPNYDIPRMNGTGAMEFFVDVTFGAVDLFATVSTNAIAELNAWYHVQNCGYRVKISGGTDYPCLSGKGIGLGRAYVRVPPQPGERLVYDEWINALVDGKGYVSEGGSHLFDFQVEGLNVGENGSEVHLAEPGSVRITCTATAWLPEVPKPTSPERSRWDIEYVRRPGRQVPVEIVVNGLPLHHQQITADGREVVIDQTLPIQRSSWIAVRVLNSSHTNSIYVIVDDQPIRASSASAKWCADVINKHWQERGGLIKATERPAAYAAYQTARSVYRAIAAEASVGPFAAAVPYGQGCAGADGSPVIGATGNPSLGNSSFEVTVSNAAVGVAPTLILSQTKQALPASPCQLLVGAPALALEGAPPANPSGASQLPFPIPANSSLEGAELFAQWIIPDGQGQLGSRFALSNALAIHLSAHLAPLAAPTGGTRRTSDPDAPPLEAARSLPASLPHVPQQRP